MKTKSIKCDFKNSRGHTLDARLDMPADYDSSDTKSSKGITFIIFCHCFTCSKETITTFRLSRLLAEQGYGVLRFDFTGLGSSEGDFSETTFTTTQDDLISAIEFLQQHYQNPTYLMGHSLGGTTALSAAQQYDFIQGVVTVASPSSPEHVLHHFGHVLTLLEQGSAASFEVAGQYYDIKPDFVENVRSIDMRMFLEELTKPVLIFDIENDALVNRSNAEEIQLWTEGETTLLEIKNTDHLLSNREATTVVANEIIEWMQNINRRPS